MISVIIATYNRPYDLKRCINSLLKSSFSNFEIIIIDQSEIAPVFLHTHPFTSKKIKYIRLEKKGKSSALNTGLSIARGDILAFTDDDCIVSRKWLLETHNTFQTHKDISAVFGQTRPYQPNLHKGKICPSVFVKNTTTLIHDPIFHATHIGFGNNMAIKKSMFLQYGNFKIWLSPGSIGSNAEDAEIALRLLIYKQRIVYTSVVRVYHNRWLTQKEMTVQELSYKCGEMACYGYFCFQGFDFASMVVSKNMRMFKKILILLFKNLIYFQWKTLVLGLRTNASLLVYLTRGTLVGLWFSIFDPIG